MADIKRLNYFTNEFLEEADFRDEQTYHRSMRYLHNSSLHTPGVVNGLQVTLSAAQVAVTPGMAVDPQGREIVLPAPQSLAKPATGSFFVTLKYAEAQTDPATRAGVTGPKRFTEGFLLETPNTPDSSAVVLASFDATGTSDPSRRQTATALLGSNSVTADKIVDGSIGTNELANNAVVTAKIADGQVAGNKLQRQKIWDTTETIQAAPNNTLIKSVFNHPVNAPKFGAIFVQAFSTTTGANFEWKQVATTDGVAPNLVVNQRVVFQNNTAAAISVTYRIYVLFD